MSSELLVRIVASRSAGEGMLPEEVVANLRIDPAALEGQRGREAFLGLLLEGAEKVHQTLRRRRWLP